MKLQSQCRCQCRPGRGTRDRPARTKALRLPARSCSASTGRASPWGLCGGRCADAPGSLGGDGRGRAGHNLCAHSSAPCPIAPCLLSTNTCSAPQDFKVGSLTQPPPPPRSSSFPADKKRGLRRNTSPSVLTSTVCTMCGAPYVDNSPHLRMSEVITPYNILLCTK